MATDATTRRGFVAISLWSVALVLSLVATRTHSVGGLEDASADRDWPRALDALERKAWDEAIPILLGVASREPSNAEVQNRLGFAYRSTGRLDDAFAHYREALRLAPGHLGAHEYIGEAYLLRGDVAAARRHLDQLEKLCGKTCDEYRDLASAIAARAQ